MFNCVFAKLHSILLQTPILSKNAGKPVNWKCSEPLAWIRGAACSDKTCLDEKHATILRCLRNLQNMFSFVSDFVTRTPRSATQTDLCNTVLRGIPALPSNLMCCFNMIWSNNWLLWLRIDFLGLVLTWKCSNWPDVSLSRTSGGLGVHVRAYMRTYDEMRACDW